jgi:hypothetical protein
MTLITIDGKENLVLLRKKDTLIRSKEILYSQEEILQKLLMAGNLIKELSKDAFNESFGQELIDLSIRIQTKEAY